MGDIIKEGEEAPDFTLEDQNGEEFTLSDHRGKKLLLSFHPLAGTSVCAKQMQSLEENKDEFKEHDAVAVGISVDSSPSKKLWAEKIGVEETRLLSDFWPHGEVSKIYGLFDEKKGFSKRANVIVDEDGKVSFSKVYPIGDVPDIDEIIGELRS